jgi:hypothetical protein
MRSIIKDQAKDENEYTSLSIRTGPSYLAWKFSDEVHHVGEQKDGEMERCTCNDESTTRVIAL